MDNKRVVVFDFGNVLAGFDHMKTCKALEKFSPFSADEIYRLIFKSDIESQYDTGQISSLEFFQSVSFAISSCNLQEYDFEYMWGDIFFENPHIMKLMNRIKSDVELYLLSNTNPIHWDYIRSLSVIRSYFPDPQKQVLSFQIGARKPSEKIFQEALKRAKTEPKNILYIDDISEYVEAFKKFGVNGFVYNCQKDSISKLEAELFRFGVLT